jgi:predicted nucleic acid-binding Zn ribbon protein
MYCWKTSNKKLLPLLEDLQYCKQRCQNVISRHGNVDTSRNKKIKLPAYLNSLHLGNWHCCCVLTLKMAQDYLQILFWYVLLEDVQQKLLPFLEDLQYCKQRCQNVISRHGNVDTSRNMKIKLPSYLQFLHLGNWHCYCVLTLKMAQDYLQILFWYVLLEDV